MTAIERSRDQSAQCKTSRHPTAIINSQLRLSQISPVGQQLAASLATNQAQRKKWPQKPSHPSRANNITPTSVPQSPPLPPTHQGEPNSLNRQTAVSTPRWSIGSRTTRGRQASDCKDRSHQSTSRVKRPTAVIWWAEPLREVQPLEVRPSSSRLDLITYKLAVVQ